MPIINGLALPSKPLPEKPSGENMQPAPRAAQNTPTMPTGNITPPQQFAPEQQQQPLPPLFEALIAEPPSASPFFSQQDANRAAAARLVARRQAEIRARLLRVHQQAQLTAVNAQMQHEQQKKEKKHHGTRMTCRSCGKNKPANAKNHGVTCTECWRKKKRSESLALISSPPKEEIPPPPVPAAQPEMLQPEILPLGHVAMGVEVEIAPVDYGVSNFQVDWIEFVRMHSIY